MTAHARRRGRRVRRGHHERRSVGRRLRLRERRARAHRRRRRVGASRVDWYQVAIKPAKPLCVRRCCRARRCSGCPGNPVSSLVSFELFARPALRHDDGPRPSRSGREVARHRRRAAPAPARRQAPPRPGRRRRGRRRATWRPACVRRRATRSPPARPPTRFALLPDGEGVDAGDPVTRHVRWTEGRASARRVETLRALVSQPAPGRPRRPHVRAARRTGRFSPSARCSPRGGRGARPRGPWPRRVTTSGRRRS